MADHVPEPMIDLTREDVLMISEVPAYLASRGGRKPHETTVRRWIDEGLNGVRLEIVMLGGFQHTSAQALARFTQALTDARQKRRARVGNIPTGEAS